MAAEGAEGETAEGAVAPSEFQASMGALMAGLASALALLRWPAAAALSHMREGRAHHHCFIC